MIPLHSVSALIQEANRGKSEPVPSENELKPASSILCTWLGGGVVLMGLPPRAGHYLAASPLSRQKAGRVQPSCCKQAPYIHPCSRNKWSAIGLFRVGLELIICLQKWEISEVAQHKRMQMITGQQQMPNHGVGTKSVHKLCVLVSPTHGASFFPHRFQFQPFLFSCPREACKGHLD